MAKALAMRVPTHLALVTRLSAPIKEMTKGCKLQSPIEHLDDMHEVSGSISSTTNERKENEEMVFGERRFKWHGHLEKRFSDSKSISSVLT